MKLTKWAIYFSEEEELTMLFDDKGNFVRFEDIAMQEKYGSEVGNWDIGNWKDFDIKGEY